MAGRARQGLVQLGTVPDGERGRGFRQGFRQTEVYGEPAPGRLQAWRRARRPGSVGPRPGRRERTSSRLALIGRSSLARRPRQQLYARPDSRSDWLSARRPDDRVRKGAGRVGVVVAHTSRVAPGRLEPSARSDSGQSRGGFSEQTHGRAGYFEVVGGCGNYCRGGPDDSDHGGHAVGLDYLDREWIGALIRPEDRMVDWVTGTRFLDKWVSGPSGAGIFWRATSLVLG
jgi:hypothetical protein